MKQTYSCENCGKTYSSYKENSRFCSAECRREYNTIMYKCDACGKEFKISRSRYRGLQTGQRKHLYCSKECLSKGNTTSVEHKCAWCGKSYMVYPSEANISKYCSRQCYQASKSCHEKLEKKACPFCGKEFTTYHHKQIYCSKDCSAQSNRDRVECVCDCCGKVFERPRDWAGKGKNKFCSNECRISFYAWTADDVEVLRSAYKKIPLEKIVPLLSKPYSVGAIKSAAGRYGLMESRVWTAEEEAILKSSYPSKQWSEVVSLFPRKTEIAVRGKARSMGLQSYFYTNRTFSEKEIEYINAHYLDMSDEQIAKALGRTAGSITSKLWVLGLKRPREIKKIGYTDIAAFVRAYIRGWVDEVRKQKGYKCELTGKKSNLIVHHIRSFNLLLDEAITNINFEVREKVEDYEDAELMDLVNEFLSVQEYYSAFTCITESVHKLFHNTYGYGNNTAEQWDEFVQRYYNGEFDQQTIL